MDIGSEQTTDLSENAFVGEKLGEVADLLEQQHASAFRVRAYRDAAQHVQSMSRNLRAIHDQDGRKGLEDLPTIGPSIAGTIAELLETGDLGMLARLRGQSDPETLFQTIPTIGPALAQAIHNDLHVDTLEALEAAAHDGRLASVKGVGPRRVDAIRHALNNMLARRRPRLAATDWPTPGVSDILSVDRQYRTGADDLPTIKPRRFNESGTHRIPILHTERGAWRFTALYSNTAAAHKFGRTRDWVVIYFENDRAQQGLATVVTQHGGSLDGLRVIRGREPECAAHYEIDIDRPNA